MSNNTSTNVIFVAFHDFMFHKACLEFTDLMKEVNILVEFYPPPTVEELSLRNEIDIGCSVCYARNAPDGGRLLRCGRCKQVKYCSAEHQELHWKEHKEECRMICAHQSSMA